MRFLVIFCLLNIAKSGSPKSKSSSVVDLDYQSNNGRYGHRDDKVDITFKSNSGYYTYNSDLDLNDNNNKYNSPSSGSSVNDGGYSEYKGQGNLASVKEIEDSYLDSLVQLKKNPKTSGYTDVVDHYYPENGNSDTFDYNNHKTDSYSKDVVYGHQSSKVNVPSQNSYNSPETDYNKEASYGQSSLGASDFSLNQDSYSTIHKNPSKKVNFHESYNQNSFETYDKSRGGSHHGRHLKADFKPSEQFTPTYSTPSLSNGFKPSFGPPAKLGKSSEPSQSQQISSYSSSNQSPESYSNSNNNLNGENYAPLGYTEVSQTQEEVPANLPANHFEGSSHLPVSEAPKVRHHQPVSKEEDQDYKVIFVKTPEESFQNAEIQLPPVPDHKTVVYLLSKSPELEQNQNVKVVTPTPTKSSHPQVYFVQYKNEQNLSPPNSEGPTPINYDYGGYPQLGLGGTIGTVGYNPYDFSNMLPLPSPSPTLASIPPYGDIQGYSRSHAFQPRPNPLQFNQDFSQLIYPTGNPLGTLTSPNSYYHQPQPPTPTYASLLNQAQQNAYIDPQSYFNLPNYPQQQLVSPKINFRGAVSPFLGQLTSTSINQLTNVIPRENGFMMTYAPTYAPYNPNPTVSGNSLNYASPILPNNPNPPTNPNPNKYYMDGNTIADLLKAYGIESSNNPAVNKHGDSNGSESETNSVSQSEDNPSSEVREKYTRSATPVATSTNSDSSNSSGVKVIITHKPSPSIRTSTSTSTSTSTTTSPTTSGTTSTTTKPPTTTGQSVQLKIALLPNKAGRIDSKVSKESKDETIEAGSEEISSEEDDEGHLDTNAELSSSEEAAVSAIEENSLETPTAQPEMNVEKTSKNQVPLHFEASKTLQEDKVLSSEEGEFGRKIRIKPSEARRLRGHKRVTKVKKPKKNRRKKLVEIT